MSIYKQFKLDDKKQHEGIEIQYGPNDNGSVPTFRLAHLSLNNQRYTKMLERESAPFKRLLALGVLDAETDNKIMVRAFCQCILLGWENVYDINNQAFPFSTENAIKLMIDLPELFLDLKHQAVDISKFRQAEVEQEAKN